MPDMRFAPPNPLRIADRASGLNAISVRSYNERFVLSLLLQNKDITRLEIGEQTGLSAQTVSVIIRSLEQEGLISKGEAQRGRVGPPTVPLSLNPDGAYSVGISVGHRQIEVVVVDFIGTVLSKQSIAQPMRTSGSNHPQFIETVKQLIHALPGSSRSRIAGIGLALPGDKAEIELAPQSSRDRFENLRDEIEKSIDLPVYVQNDITAAAGGESMFGAAKKLPDYLYFYLGAHLHSRLVLNHQIYNTQAAVSKDVGIFKLQESLEMKGTTQQQLWDRAGKWADFGKVEEKWRTNLVKDMANSITALSQFIPLSTIILSSYAPQETCRRICVDLEATIPGIRAIAGSISGPPKAVGAASLPFSSRFMVE